MKHKKLKIAAISVGALAAACVAGLVITGWQIGWGPFAGLFDWDREVNPIASKYPAQERQHEVVFYGASNFRLWTELENDLSGYKVQNHGFGGSTDKLLVKYAPVLLYPYQPDIVFFQTGSNDYVALSGTDEEKVAACMEYKREMFAAFHEQLPNAKFVVMSGLLLPGRAEFTALTQRINEELAALCAQTDYLYFVDASALTYDGQDHAVELFQGDGIHLNHDGQLLWRDGYIQPQLERLIQEFGLDHLRRTED